MSANDDENYIFGTSQGKSYVLRYDTQQMKFQQIEQNEDKQLNNWACVIKLNDDEYLLTGGLNSTGKIISNEVVCFNIKNYQLSYFPSFNQCRYVHQGLQKNGCIYILGGRQYGPDFDSVLNHCEKFQNGAWKVIAPMTKRRSNFQVFLLNGQIHAIGGFDGKKNTKSVEWYDEDKNIWRKSKIRLNRGLAGFQLIPKDQNKLLIVGGLTLQGPTQACHLLDLRDNTIQAECTLIEQRSLAHMIVDAGNYIIYGGMQKPNIFELYDEGWNQAFIHIQEELQEIFNSGLRGFSSNNKIIQYNLEEYQEEPLDLDPQDYNFLIGNDEFPFIQLIPKFECELPPPIPIPTKLKLFSYMSSCSIDAELPNCRQLFVGAGIDNKISVINKRCYIITIIFPELKIKVKNIGKIQYYRYAASCVYKAPYVYIIGGRGYQNDILSLHSTVERFNIDNEEWEQVSGLNEPKCSLTSCVYNDKIYVIGGYIGEGQITHKIECFDEFANLWNYLNLELPYALEGLSSIIVDDSLLIIGGKSNDGSSKDIIKFDELEQNQNTSGQIIGQLKYKRSLPKVFLQDDGSLLILGGQFFDSPETTFGEVINGTSQFLQNLQNIMVNMGSDNQLNMFCIA